MTPARRRASKKPVKLTPQPHIWPQRPIGVRFATDPQEYVITQAVCLDCGWESTWTRTMAPTHAAGFQHECDAAGTT
jgi:hypothetical protein